MSTHDVPGSKKHNADVLAMGCWAEHDDGSLILVEGTEGGTVVYSIFDVAQDPPVEYRDAMPEVGFMLRFSYPEDDLLDDTEVWTWHDKTSFPWDQVMDNFPAGGRSTSAVATLTAAQRVAASLNLHAERVRDREVPRPYQKAAKAIMVGIRDAVSALRS